MSRNAPAWLDNTPPPDVETLSEREVLEIWAANRNNMLGVMAASEVARRRYSQLKETTDA